MPVICTKEKSKYEIITGRVLEKRRADSKVNNQTLRTFSVKNVDAPTNSKFFIGTSIPNSTVKGVINWKGTTQNTTNGEVEEFYDILQSADNKTEFQKTSLKQTTTSNEKNKDDDDRHSHQNSFSIVSGSEKLKELQKLQKQLQRNYEPKPLFAPRRPTLESIKSAIERAKHENERNKNVGTDDYDYKSSVTMTDATTSTEKIVRQKFRKRTPKEMQGSTSNFPPASEIKSRNSKRITVNIKSNKKVDKLPDKK